MHASFHLSIKRDKPKLGEQNFSHSPSFLENLNLPLLRLCASSSQRPLSTDKSGARAPLLFNNFHIISHHLLDSTQLNEVHHIPRSSGRPDRQSPSALIRLRQHNHYNVSTAARQAPLSRGFNSPAAIVAFGQARVALLLSILIGPINSPSSLSRPKTSVCVQTTTLASTGDSSLAAHSTCSLASPPAQNLTEF